jgi:nitrate reductase NapE component
MTIDEEKILSGLTKEKVDNLTDYNTFTRLDDQFKSKKKSKRIVVLLISLLVYVLISVTVLYSFRNRADVLFWPLNISSDGKTDPLIDKKITALTAEISDLKFIIASTSQEYTSFNYLNSQIRELQNRERALEDSISLEPDKALTAAVLREDQKNVESSLTDVRDSEARLESKLDNFITTVVIVPIVTAIIGIIIWLLQGRLKKRVKYAL